MIRTCRASLVAALGTLGLAAPLGLGGGPAQPSKTTPPTVDFAREVFPVLQKACFECHGEQKQRGKLRLDSRSAMLKGGSGGPILVPGKAEDSELLRRIALPKGSEDLMPARGEPLTKAQVEVIRTWINQGAIWPDNLQLQKHWAYVKPDRPPLPRVEGTSWPRTPVDHFVLARLEKEGL